MTDKFVLVDCPSCGIVFGLPKLFKRALKESHDGFFCPNGHELTFRAPEKEKQKHSFQPFSLIDGGKKTS